MAARKRIGLYFESYRTLPAYVIYVINLVRTLQTAEDERKPHLVILHLHDSPLDELKQTGYPYLEFYQLKDIYASAFKRAVNKISRAIRGSNLLPFTDDGFPGDLDVIFPYAERKESKYVRKKLVWKPDFQEFHLPQFFTLSELTSHRSYVEQLSRSGLDLILSSEDARRDYEKYFPSHNNNIHIWKFTSSLPLPVSDRTGLRRRHGLDQAYFLVANQFWPHKNHLNVLKAIVKLKERGTQVKVLFTGKQSSSRDPELFDKLKLFIEMNNIQQNIVFTGFLSRQEQVALMDDAVAVIQPSLFEGWSTVIEDCKALGQFVIASDISVNREQISTNVSFFDPHDADELADRMKDLITSPPVKVKRNYVDDIHAFREQLLSVLM